MARPRFHLGLWLVRFNESRGIFDNRYCVIVYLATYDKEPITEQDFSNGPIRAKGLI